LSNSRATKRRGRRPAPKAVVFVTLSALLFYLQLIGCEYVFYYAVLLTGLTVYDYNLPYEFFGARAVKRLGSLRRLFPVLAVLGCTLNLLAGRSYAVGVRLAASGFVLFAAGQVPMDVFFISVVIELSPAVAVLIGFPLVSLLVVIWLSRKITGFKEEIEMYLTATGILFEFSFILGAGGQVVLTAIVGILTAGYAILAAAKIRKPRDVVEAIKDIGGTKAGLEKAVWLGWLESGRPEFPQKMALNGLMYMILGYFLFNIGFLEIENTGQLVVAGLLACSLILAFYALRVAHLSWWFSLTASIPAYAGLVLSSLKPEVFPVAEYFITLLKDYPWALYEFRNSVPIATLALNILLGSFGSSACFYAMSAHMRWKRNRRGHLAYALTATAVLTAGLLIAAYELFLAGLRYFEMTYLVGFILIGMVLLSLAALHENRAMK